jgi:hypothetical protein
MIGNTIGNKVLYGLSAAFLAGVGVQVGAAIRARTGDDRPPTQAVASGTYPAGPVNALHSSRRVATPESSRVQDEGPIQIAEGTTIRVRMAHSLSTTTHRPGDAFTATLAGPLLSDDIVVAPTGSTVTGRVVSSDDGGRVKGRALLAIQATSLRTPAGRTIDLTTNTFAVRARATKKHDAAKIGIGSGVGAAIGAIAGGGKGAAIGAAAGAGAGTGYVMATHGAPAVIGSEALVTFRLRSPVLLARR